MEAYKKTLSEIFNRSRMLMVPYYQRSYVWKEPQWERFLEDMKSIAKPTGKAYFLGSVILKQVETPVGATCGDVRTVIDGQQRLTTLMVFFKVLSLKKKKPSIFNTFLIASGDDDESEEKEVAFRHNHIDKPDFERIMALEKLEELGVDKDGNVKEDLPQLIKLYRFFKDRILVEDFENSKLIINRLLFVYIGLNNDEDEQQIFDTINSLGVKLTTTELLKNYFFNESNEKEYKTLWMPIFESTPEQKGYWDRLISGGTTKTPLSDLFFAAFLNIKTRDPKYDISAEKRKEYCRISDLFNSYKDFVKNYMGNDRGKLMREIRDYAEIFMEFFRPDEVDEAVLCEPCFERLNLMIFAQGWSTMLPYAMYVLKNVKDGAERDAICGILESYILRRLVSGADTRAYYSLFSDRLLVKQCLTAKGLDAFLNQKGKGVDYAMPSDEEVVKGAREQRLVNKEGMAVLYMLESRLMTNAHATTLKGYCFYTLEHLMPRKWKQYWPAVMTDAQAQARDRVIRTLGNFTILPGKLNTSISNAKWKDKVEGKKGRPGLRANASGLILLKKYLGCPNWNEKQILKRADEIAKKMLTVWPEHYKG